MRLPQLRRWAEPAPPAERGLSAVPQGDLNLGSVLQNLCDNDALHGIFSRNGIKNCNTICWFKSFSCVILGRSSCFCL